MTKTTDEPIFGTDGIRGRALEGWLSARAVEALGRAAARVLGGDGTGVALIAHDGRASAEPLAEALARGFAREGLTSRSAGLLPTPGLAWLTANGEIVLGAMISASHNPARDNGIKLFAGGGAKLSDDEQAEIERLLRQEIDRIDDSDTASSSLQHDPTLSRSYVDHLVESASGEEQLDLSGLDVAIDCANGAASDVGPAVLRALGANVEVLFASPDGSNINAGCGSTEPGELRALVARRGGLGIALDGDADRCLLVDERGEIVDGDGIMTILARDAVERGVWDDKRIVATVMSNRGLQRALEPVGVEVVEVGVGDRQVVEGLREHGLQLGGEKSGHVIFGAESGFIGDGLLTGLKVLGVMARSGRSVSDLCSSFVPYPQVLLGLEVAAKPDLETLSEFSALRARCEEELAPAGRVNVRYSGTEPKARVMVEGEDEGRIRAMADELVDVLRREIAAR